MMVIPNTTKKIRSILAALVLSSCVALSISAADASEPVESGAGMKCGVLRSFVGEVQVFDATRTHLGDAAFGTKLNCGDWISVDQGKAVIENLSGATLLVSGGTFIQILDPSSGENPDHAHFALYRGELFLQTEKSVQLLTPNGLARIAKGGAFVLYSPTREATQVVGLGAKASLANRFFAERSVPTEFAKVVEFSNPVERLSPDAARIVNAKDLNERLTKLGAKPELLASIEKAAKAGAKIRMPVTLASSHLELRNGGELNAPSSNRISSRPARAPASLGKVAAQPVPKKLAFRTPVRSGPDFSLKRPANEALEKKKLLESLATLRPDEE